MRPLTAQNLHSVKPKILLYVSNIFRGDDAPTAARKRVTMTERDF